MSGLSFVVVSGPPSSSPSPKTSHSMEFPEGKEFTKLLYQQKQDVTISLDIGGVEEVEDFLHLAFT